MLLIILLAQANNIIGSLSQEVNPPIWKGGGGIPPPLKNPIKNIVDNLKFLGIT